MRAVDPHACDLADPGVERLERAAAGGLAAEAGDHEGGRSLVAGPDEALLEALVELGVVVLEAPARVARRRVLERDREHRERQQAAHLVLGIEQPVALLVAQWLECGGRERGPGPVPLSPLGAGPPGKAGAPRAPGRRGW